MSLDFEQKVEQDKRNNTLNVDANETFYRAREMKKGVEEMRIMSRQSEPLTREQDLSRRNLDKLVKNGRDIQLDYDESKFTLDEVTDAAAFLTRAKEYGYSSEVDVTDNPILYKKVRDENNPAGTKLKKRGYFEKKSIKKSAKRFRTKYKEMYAARVSEEIEKYRDKDVYDIGNDVSFDAQVKFEKEDIDKIRNRDVLKVNMDDQVSRFVLGLPAQKTDQAKEDSEKRKIDKLYDDFGELQGLMNTDLFKKYLIKQPSVLNSYASKSVFVPGLFVGIADFYTLATNYTRWSADPGKYGFEESGDRDANGGLNTARLRVIGDMLKTVMSLSSMARQAVEYKNFVNSVIDNNDPFNITEGETIETVRPHTRTAAAKAARITDELNQRYGGAMRTLIDMHNDILRHNAYLGEDKKNRNNTAALPTLNDYLAKRTDYIDT